MSTASSRPAGPSGGRPATRRLTVTPLGVFVGSVIAGGAALLTWAALTTSIWELPGETPLVWWTFTILLLIAEVRPIGWLRRRESSIVTASLAYNCALIFVTPGFGALLVGALATLIAEVARRAPPVRSAFNVAMLALAIGAGTAVLDLTGARDSLTDPGNLSWTFLPAVVLVCVAIYLTNALLITTVVGLHERTGVWATIRRDFATPLPTDGVLLALGPVLVVVAEVSYVLLPMLLVVALAVFRSARMAFERQHEATHDALTGLPNRRLFAEQTELTIARADRTRGRAAVLIVDLDGFKEINDLLGHDIGDKVLQRVARQLRGALRPQDMVARLGGDEFGVLLASVADRQEAAEVAQRLSQAVSSPKDREEVPVTVGASFGLAIYPDQGSEASLLLRHADAAMYTAKAQGGGAVVTSDTHSSIARGRITLLQEMERALQRPDQFFLVYQPKVDLVTGEVLGLEALVRWQHPELGLVMPDSFIPLAEQTDLIGPLTDLVLAMALAQCAELNADGIRVHVAVNLSARNLHDLRFAGSVADALKKAGVEPDLLQLELTENTLLSDPGRTAFVMQELRDLGVSLAIDDFGTGYSSLTHLRELPVQSIKIDRRFVRNLVDDPHDAAIVDAIVNLGHILGLRMVAEGIESPEVLERLAIMGCDEAQGYHIARPMSPDHLRGWLSGRAAALQTRPPTEATVTVVPPSPAVLPRIAS